MPGMNPTVNVGSPRAAAVTRRWSASAEVSSGPASSIEILTGGGEGGAAPVAQQQLDPELVLEGPDLAGEHRLCDVQARGGPAEVQFLRHGDEVTQLS